MSLNEHVVNKTRALLKMRHMPQEIDYDDEDDGVLEAALLAPAPPRAKEEKKEEEEVQTFDATSMFGADAQLSGSSEELDMEALVNESHLQEQINQPVAVDVASLEPTEKEDDSVEVLPQPMEEDEIAVSPVPKSKVPRRQVTISDDEDEDEDIEDKILPSPVAKVSHETMPLRSADLYTELSEEDEDEDGDEKNGDNNDSDDEAQSSSEKAVSYMTETDSEAIEEDDGEEENFSRRKRRKLPQRTSKKRGITFRSKSLGQYIDTEAEVDGDDDEEDDDQDEDGDDEEEDGFIARDDEDCAPSLSSIRALQNQLNMSPQPVRQKKKAAARDKPAKFDNPGLLDIDVGLDEINLFPKDAASQPWKTRDEAVLLKYEQTLKIFTATMLFIPDDAERLRETSYTTMAVHNNREAKVRFAYTSLLSKAVAFDKIKLLHNVAAQHFSMFVSQMTEQLDDGRLAIGSIMFNIHNTMDEFASWMVDCGALKKPLKKLPLAPGGGIAPVSHFFSFLPSKFTREQRNSGLPTLYNLVPQTSIQSTPVPEFVATARRKATAGIPVMGNADAATHSTEDQGDEEMEAGVALFGDGHYEATFASAFKYSVAQQITLTGFKVVFTPNHVMAHLHTVRRQRLLGPGSADELDQKSLASAIVSGRPTALRFEFGAEPLARACESATLHALFGFLRMDKRFDQCESPCRLSHLQLRTNFSNFVDRYEPTDNTDALLLVTNEMPVNYRFSMSIEVYKTLSQLWQKYLATIALKEDTAKGYNDARARFEQHSVGFLRTLLQYPNIDLDTASTKEENEGLQEIIPFLDTELLLLVSAFMPISIY